MEGGKDAHQGYLIIIKAPRGFPGKEAGQEF
jgi:hypothetical protein